MALGVGSLFNHSKQPNLYFAIDHDHLVIRYEAARNIAAHEELTICYGSESKLWFEDRSVNTLQNSSSMVHEYMDDETSFLAGLQLDNGNEWGIGGVYLMMCNYGNSIKVKLVIIKKYVITRR